MSVWAKGDEYRDSIKGHGRIYSPEGTPVNWLAIDTDNEDLSVCWDPKLKEPFTGLSTFKGIIQRSYQVAGLMAKAV